MNEVKIEGVIVHEVELPRLSPRQRRGSIMALHAEVDTWLRFNRPELIESPEAILTDLLELKLLEEDPADRGHYRMTPLGVATAVQVLLDGPAADGGMVH